MQNLIIATDSEVLDIKNKLQTKTKLKTLLFNRFASYLSKAILTTQVFVVEQKEEKALFLTICF